jgi:hypothetical protein
MQTMALFDLSPRPGSEEEGSRRMQRQAFARHW